MTGSGRYVSGLYRYFCIGWGLPLIVLGSGLIWLASYGYPAMAGFGIVVGALGVRASFVAFFGGVVVCDDVVRIRGWLKRQDVARSEIEAIRIRRVWMVEPDGWLVTSRKPVHLSGTSIRHTHSVFWSGPCPVCTKAEELLTRLALELDVPVVEESATPVP